MAMKIQTAAAAFILTTIAGGAMAVPRIVSFGTGPSVTSISADGTIVGGALGGVATRFTIAPTSYYCDGDAGLVECVTHVG